MIRKQIYLAKVQIDKIKQSAKRSGLSFSEVLRRVIDAHYGHKKIT